MGPSPSVVWFGDGLIPFNTELRAEKLAARTVVVYVRFPAAVSRESNSTSDGEFARVGTLGVRIVFESKGKMRYISTSTSPSVGVPPPVDTITPVNVAELICAPVPPIGKSSAASISILP